jgi:hypothetical protein
MLTAKRKPLRRQLSAAKLQGSSRLIRFKEADQF